MDVDLSLGDGLRARALVAEDAALLVEATAGETAPAVWGPQPAGPYTLSDAQDALARWDPAANGEFSIGILRDRRLLGAVGVMPDGPGSAELAYWIRPDQRRQGVGARALRAVTLWAHDALELPRLWLEIKPGNEPSLRLAQRAGYQFEQRIPRHCREWVSEDPERDSWHDCLIWTHLNEPAPDASGPSERTS